jgi:hypothetical protein
LIPKTQPQNRVRSGPGARPKPRQGPHTPKRANGPPSPHTEPGSRPPAHTPPGPLRAGGSVNPVSQRPMRPTVGNHTMIATLSHLPSLHIISRIIVNLPGISCFFACEEEGKNVG